jgi:inorganic pyrophosphatase
MRHALFALLLLAQSGSPPATLPRQSVLQLGTSLAAAADHSKHLWRDISPLDQATGHLTGFIEIPRGERRKFEFDMTANGLRLDRVLPQSIGGYPVNYGFVPQTISYDGDPFDVLVLGPALPAGSEASGTIIGLMHMEDEKGLDSKVVISPVDVNGRARFQLTAAERNRIARFFRGYKRHEPGKFSRVPGWGSAADGLAFVRTTHAFFRQCRAASADCVLGSR